jgi:collagen type I/II/III/V/XI/XXIV/XXVII alpha
MTKLFDDSTSSNSGSAQIVSVLGGAGPVYQSFLSGAVPATLTSISMDLTDAAAAFDGGTVTITLFSDGVGSVGTSQTVLGTFADNTISTAAAGAFDTIALSSTYTLAANTVYWIGLTSSLIGQGPYWHYTTAPVGTTGFKSEAGTTPSNNEALMILNDSSLCFASGAQVLTARGEVRVETLVEGDRVVGIRSGKLQTVNWIGRRDVDLRTHPDPDSINPVRVCADAFGPGQPCRDLILSPNHALYVDGHLIAVRYLLNGATIRQEQWDRITYYHVELESHDIMLVDGMTAESFLDVGNRGAFSNGGEPVMLHPDFARTTWDTEACAPDLPKGEDLTQLRQRLLDRVMPLGHALTDDPDICVMAGKRRIRPIEVAEGFRFNLPKGSHTVQIASRSFRPNEMRADGNDSRLLGVGVLSLTLDDTQIALDDGRLTDGWHAPEPGLRWTQGEASLQTQGARTLTLRLFRGQHYWIQAEAAEDAHAAA